MPLARGSSALPSVLFEQVKGLTLKSTRRLHYLEFQYIHVEELASYATPELCMQYGQEMGMKEGVIDKWSPAFKDLHSD